MIKLQHAFLLPTLSTLLILLTGNGQADADIAGLCNAWPSISGEVLTSETDKAPYSQDFGRLGSLIPRAVFRPRSISDLRKILATAKRCKLPIVVRGAGHSPKGQAQTEEGIVIDLRHFNKVLQVNTKKRVFETEAGATWWHVIENLKRGNRQYVPSVFTGHLGTTVGGTLSVGGGGMTSFRYGAQVDQVIKIKFMDGTGKLRMATPHWNTKAFRSVLGGFGQFGILISVKLNMIPVLPMLRTYSLVYCDAQNLTNDIEQRIRYHPKVFSVSGLLARDKGIPQFIMNIGVLHDGVTLPDDQTIIKDLTFCANGGIHDAPLVTHMNLAADWAKAFEQTGLVNQPKPWFDFMIGSESFQQFSNIFFREVPFEDLAKNPLNLVLLFPVRTDLGQSFLHQRPHSARRMSYGIGLMQVAPPGDPASYEKMKVTNALLSSEGYRLGGKGYLIDTQPANDQEWEEHFQDSGTSRKELQRIKQSLDPYGLFKGQFGLFIN